MKNIYFKITYGEPFKNFGEKIICRKDGETAKDTERYAKAVAKSAQEEFQTATLKKITEETVHF